MGYVLIFIMFIFKTEVNYRQKKLKFKNLKLRLRSFRVLVQISWNPKYKVGIYLAKSKLHSFFRGGGDFPSV